MWRILFAMKKSSNHVQSSNFSLPIFASAARRKSHAEGVNSERDCPDFIYYKMNLSCCLIVSF